MASEFPLTSSLTSPLGRSGVGTSLADTSNASVLGASFDGSSRLLSTLKSDIECFLTEDVKDLSTSKLAGLSDDDIRRLCAKQQVQIAQLEKKLGEGEAVREHEREMKEMRQDLHDTNVAAEKLRAELSSLRGSSNKETQELKEEVAELTGYITKLTESEGEWKRKYEEGLGQWEASKKNLQVELRKSERDSVTALDDLNEERARLGNRVRNLELELQEKEKEVCQLQAQAMAGLNRPIDESGELKSQLEISEQKLHQQKLEIESLQARLAVAADNDGLIKSLKVELKRLVDVEQSYRSLQQKSSELSTHAQDFDKIKEQCEAQRAKISRLEQLVSGQSALEAQLSAANAKIEEWKLSIREAGYDENKADAAFVLRELRQQNVVQQDELGALKTELKRLEQESKNQSAQPAVVKDEVPPAVNVDELLQKKDRRIGFLTKERDGLKKILETYTEETTVLGQEKGEDDAANERLSHYEDLVNTSHAHVQALEDELKEVKLKLSGDDVPSGAVAELRRVKALLEGSEAEKSRMNREIEKLNTELGKLESRLAKGEYNPATTKVLHLTANPEAIKRGTLKNTAAESKANDAATAALETKITQLTSLVDQEKKYNERLREIFAKKVKDYKTSIHRLIGYKIEMQKSKMILTSDYAERADDVLAFAISDNGIDLIATDFAQGLKEARETYLNRFHSIPAFLSQVTLDLFNSQTFK